MKEKSNRWFLVDPKASHTAPLGEGGMKEMVVVVDVVVVGRMLRSPFW